MPGGSGVLGCNKFLSTVLQARAAGRFVLLAMFEFGGNPTEAGEGTQDEPVPVHRQDNGRVFA